MEWVIVAIVTGLGGWYAVSKWLAVPPPAAQLACRTCPKLQRQVQAWKLGFATMTIVAFAATVWAMTR